MTDRIDRLFLAALTLATIVYLILFGYFLGATTIRVPVYDLLGWIVHYDAALRSGDWWNYLWQPHNEHRLVYSRLLLLADIRWFRGTTAPFLIFGFVCLAVMIAAIARVALASPLPVGLKATLALAVPLLLATTYIVVDCTMPALGVYVHTAVFAVLALVLLDGAGEGGAFAGLRRVLALLAGVGAGFGIAGGLIIWPVLLWAGWRGGLGRAWLVAIGVAGAAAIAVYLPGVRSHGGIGSLDAERVLRMLDYAIRFLGLPWSHAPALVWFGRTAGTVVLAAGLFVLVRWGLLARGLGRMERIGIGMLLFTLLMAALAGVGRVDIATDREMPIRYSIFIAMAQLGLLMAAAPWLSRLWAELRWRRLLQMGVLAATVLLLVQQVVAGRAGADVAREYADAYRKFAAGLWTPEMVQFVYPDRAMAEQGQAIVKQLGIYQSY